ncbi:TPA: response regulator receiver domain [Serratia marcescens]
MTKGITFSDLVREAFIDPLRSVLIVDDQYPTWEEILNNAINTGVSTGEKTISPTAKDWIKQPLNPLGIISQFRKRNPGFIIDIHDAIERNDEGAADVSEDPVALANHLYQSDLLVLDYNLEGHTSGLRGDKARRIIQSVLANKHFNLVIVHTGEDNLNEVFFECLQCLMKSCTSQFKDVLIGNLIKLDEKLELLEDEGSFNRKELSNYFDMNEYVRIRHPDSSESSITRDYMSPTGKLAPLAQWGKSLGLNNNELKTFLYWSIREFEKPISSIFAQQQFEGLKWHNEPDCKWVRTVRGFVTFVSKGPEDLLGELQKALESWKPTPSRLLSAKYRHQLSSVGVEAEDRTLLKSHVYAHLYKEILGLQSKNNQEKIRAAKLKEHVSRQSEAISFHIEDEIVIFGEKIVNVDSDGDYGFSNHYGVDLNNTAVAKKAIAHYNSYISTLPLKNEKDQLDSGHIFKINGEWWVCATPACDLQPMQNTIAFTGSSQELRPFTALLLRQTELSSISSDHINSGTYCFIENTPGEIVALGLRIPGEDGKPVNEKVTWRTFLAKNNGEINNHTLELLLPKLDNQNFVSKEATAKIIAKLRYEYALNYINKVGASVSRIGLGYVAFDKEEV